MTGWGWVAPAASFAGAGLAYLGAWSGSRQQEGAGRREEWGRRFTSALEAVRSSDARSRALGRTVLAELARSELATAEERALADALLEEQARLDPSGRDVAAAFAAGATFVQDSGPQEGPVRGGEPRAAPSGPASAPLRPVLVSADQVSAAKALVRLRGAVHLVDPAVAAVASAAQVRAG